MPSYGRTATDASPEPTKYLSFQCPHTGELRQKHSKQKARRQCFNALIRANCDLGRSNVNIVVSGFNALIRANCDGQAAQNRCRPGRVSMPSYGRTATATFREYSVFYSIFTMIFPNFLILHKQYTLFKSPSPLYMHFLWCESPRVFMFDCASHRTIIEFSEHSTSHIHLL